MNILVTGGAGFIGSEFVIMSVELGYNVVVLDSLSYSGNIENLKDVENNINFIEGNICNTQLVADILNKNNIDWLVHFAAESHVDNSIESPKIFIETNIEGTFNLLNESLKYYNNLSGDKKNKFRFIHVSTDEVFGELELDSKEKFTEDTSYSPNSPYSASKAASDHLARAWHKTYNLPIIITNCSNNFGARQHPEKLIPKIITNALAGKDLPIYGDGKNIRDWIYVKDHCKGIHLALTKGKIGESYCFGGNQEKSNIEIVNAICEILDQIKPKPNGSYKEQITFVEDRAGHDRRYAIDDSKAVKELGFARESNFEDYLLKTVETYV